MSRRLVVVGLDCADPSVVFGEVGRDLPTLRRLMTEGTFGVLRSCVPPITVPAWTVLTTGRDPGELGLYGFRNRVGRTYREGKVAGSGAVRAPRVWDRLSRAGRPSVVVGVPPSYPVYPINGVWVGCFLTPGVGAGCCHPSSLDSELAGYRFDVTEYRTHQLDRLRRELWEMTSERFGLMDRLIRSQPWDLFMFVEIGVDRAQHAFWRHFDPDHRKYAGAGNAYADVIPEYYRMVDRRLGRLLAEAGDEANVLVVSDHGARRMDGVLCINQWLVDQGLLVLRDKPAGPADLSPDLVDWSKTKAWASGGYYARIYLNIAGRDPEGLIPRSEVPVVVADLKARLRNLMDDQGRSLPVTTYQPEHAYRAITGSPPDLMAFFGDLRWRASTKVGVDGIHLTENDTGPDGANHSFEGIYIGHGPDFARRGRGPDRVLGSMFDSITTLLDLEMVDDA